MESTRKLLRSLSVLSLVACVLLAAGRPAAAYTDPGSGAMIWQLAVASIVGLLFYVRRLAVWLGAVQPLQENSVGRGFLFATLYGGIASLVALHLFGGHPVPRFGDIFLIGVVLTVHLFSWQPALFLYFGSLPVTIYVLPPFGQFRIGRSDDVYRIVSYSVCCLFLIWIVERQRAKRVPTADEAVIGMAATSGQRTS